MIKNTEYEISILEITKLLKRKWKLICVVMLACIVLCAGYKIATDLNGTQDIQPDGDYEADVEHYEYLAEAEEYLPEYLEESWERISYDRMNNPVFSVNPYNCKYEQIVILFDNENSNHDWTVSNWIAKVDNRSLFGEQEDRLSDYKSSLIFIGQKSGTVQSSETAVQIIAVKGFDSKKAADYLIRSFKQYASEDGIDIVGVSSVTVKGYNETVERYQQNNRDKYNSLSNAYTNSKNMSSNIVEPSDPSGDKKIALKSIIKFGLLGMILGFVLAVACVVVDVIRKREVISAQQVEGSFGLELLGDCSAGSEISLDVLNANLDVMTEEHSTIAVVVEKNIEIIDEFSSEWTSKSDRSFILCTDIFDNPESIEALKKAKGIVLGIKVGKSKLDQIQRIILKANKLNLNVLGFVLL